MKPSASAHSGDPKTQVEALPSISDRARFLADAVAGLSQPQKQLPAKWFYDARGAELFDRICGLPEYAVQRLELALLAEHGPAMARTFGPRGHLIELGSGTGAKTRALLDAAPNVVAYTPIDVCGPQLEENAQELAALYPRLEVLPLCADYTRDLTFPRPSGTETQRAVWFPGSTIGNLRPLAARALLGRIARWIAPNGQLLIGIDLIKPLETLLAAYDDAQGVTAQFNRNVLYRMARELGAEVNPEDFEHQARWDPERAAIEMHLVASRELEIGLAGRRFHFQRGESIHTEDSHKYSLERFMDLAENFKLARAWTDPGQSFAVLSLSPK